MDYLAYKDAIYVTSAETFEYVIKKDNEYIFRGLSRKAPDADFNYINVGEICRQYLDNYLPDFRDLERTITSNGNAFLSFVLFSVNHTIIYTGPDTYIDDVTEQAEQIFKFLYNWDYVTEDMENGVLSDPVNGRLDCRMKLMYTEFKDALGNSFYVTPLLSAPSSGATLHADIVTDYIDLTPLTLTINNSAVTYSSLTLTGVDFIILPNTGYTYSVTVNYYYYGSLVGTTIIIVAGDLGDNGLITGDTQGHEYSSAPEYAGTIHIMGGWYDYLHNSGNIMAISFSGDPHTYSYAIEDNDFVTGNTKSGNIESAFSQILYTNSMRGSSLIFHLLSGEVNDETRPALGYTVGGSIYKDGELLKPVDIMVTSHMWAPFGQSTNDGYPYVTEYVKMQTVKVKNLGYKPGWSEGSENYDAFLEFDWGIHHVINGGVLLNPASTSCYLCWITVLEENVWAVAGTTSTAYTEDGWLELSQSTKSNGFLLANGNQTDVQAMLPSDVAYLSVEDYKANNGVTHLYIDCTLEYFNAMPVIEYGEIKIGKRYKAREGAVLRVHCVDGELNWTPTEIVTHPIP